MNRLQASAAVALASVLLSCGAGAPTTAEATESAASTPAHPTGGSVLVHFPKDFQFGFATVAHQSEGARRADGSIATSNWSQWEDMGKVAREQHNDYGNGFFQGYAADLDRAAGLGANSFSYALDWARLEPKPGVFDDAELARVVKIVQAIRARGMRPLIVLFHWVTPPWVQSPVDGTDLLGREGSGFVEAFLPMVQHVVPALAGLVDDWVTLEEPWSVLGGEYLGGVHPPGHKGDLLSVWGGLTNLAYLNAKTYHLVKSLDNQDADGDGTASSVGLETIAIAINPLVPEDKDDVEAAKHYDYVVNHEFMKAVVYGDLDLNFDGDSDDWWMLPHERHDPELMNTVDFIGLNYYQAARAEGGIYSLIPMLHGMLHMDVREYDAKLPHSDMYQEISASGLRKVIEEFSVYKLPMIVTENGIADAKDDRRPFFELEHLRVIGQAIADGYDVRGYYSWTISDNFEWGSGIDMRFGVYAVDFADPAMPRTRRTSADVLEAIYKAGHIDQAMWDKWSLAKYPIGP